jgi:hypothetical protein
MYSRHILQETGKLLSTVNLPPQLTLILSCNLGIIIPGLLLSNFLLGKDLSSSSSLVGWYSITLRSICITDDLHHPMAHEK